MATLQAMPTLEQAVNESSIEDALAYFQLIDPTFVYDISNPHSCAVQQYFRHRTGLPGIACSTLFIGQSSVPEFETWDQECRFPDGYWATALQRKLIYDPHYIGYYYTAAAIVQALEELIADK